MSLIKIFSLSKKKKKKTQDPNQPRPRPLLPPLPRHLSRQPPSGSPQHPPLTLACFLHARGSPTGGGQDSCGGRYRCWEGHGAEARTREEGCAPEYSVDAGASARRPDRGGGGRQNGECWVLGRRPCLGGGSGWRRCRWGFPLLGTQGPCVSNRGAPGGTTQGDLLPSALISFVIERFHIEFFFLRVVSI